MTGPHHNSYSPAPARIGSGHQPAVIHQTQHAWADVEIAIRSEDIRQSTDWCIRENRNLFIVHLAGQMDVLETELEGHGGCSGPAIPGEVWSVPAGLRYHGHARGGRISYAEIHIDVEDQEGTEAADVRSVAGMSDDWTFRRILAFRNAVSGDDPDLMTAQSLAISISESLRTRYSLRLDQKTRRPTLPLKREASRLIREFILDSLSHRILLDDLAGLVGLTPHQLLVSFRKSFGTTPAQYILQQRIRAAQRLLLHSNADMTTIALQLGFSSHSHLTSTFQSRLGCTPSDFRRRSVSQ